MFSYVVCANFMCVLIYFPVPSVPSVVSGVEYCSSSFDCDDPGAPFCCEGDGGGTRVCCDNPFKDEVGQA